MAAGFLSKPGTKLGPCEDSCEHRDCALTRKMAETVCHLCDEKIGYDTAFYEVNSKYVHGACEHDRVDRVGND